jgi:hypothetical protein
VKQNMAYRSILISVCDYSGAWSQPYADAGTLVLQVDPKLDTCDHKGNGYGDGGTGAVIDLGPNRVGLACTAGQLAEYVREEGGYFLDRLCRSYCSGYDGVVCGGLLLAPPCTDYSSSGARWFAAKDLDGRTESSDAIIRDCLSLVDLLGAEWWCLENPVGRLPRCVPEVGPIRMRFDPTDYALLANDGETEKEAMTKRTCLYGDFNINLFQAKIDPVMYTDSKGNRGSWQWMHLGGKSERTKELRSMTPTGFSRSFHEANPIGPDDVFEVNI